MADTFALALAAHRNGQLERAEHFYKQVLADEPNYVNALTNLGTLHVQQGDVNRALLAYDRAIAADPLRIDALYNRATLWHRIERLPEALADFDAIIRLNPTHADSLCNRGVVLDAQGQTEDAVQAFDRALEARPDHLLSAGNRAALLFKLDRLEEAFDAYGRARTLAPQSADFALQSALIQLRRSRFVESLALCDEAAGLGADSRELHAARAGALESIGRFDEALQAADRALALDPTYAKALAIKGIIKLATGDHRTGWALLERRWEAGDVTPHIFVPSAPRWSMAAGTQGETVLLHAEQGAGDALQMLRYAPLLARTGAKVIVCIFPELIDLARRVEGVERVCAPSDLTRSMFDSHCPMMSLPFAFETGADDIPANVPYLAASEGLADEWRRRLPDDGRLRVGLAWSGNPGHSNDANRSLPLDALQVLAGLEARFVSLQPGYREGDQALLDRGPGIEDVSALLTDFEQTAALIATLDLVITVDTAVAHLAGAMGKPVWILLPYKADYRWGAKGRDSAWYPTARLLRQPRPGDWASVLVGVRQELGELIAAR